MKQQQAAGLAVRDFARLADAGILNEGIGPEYFRRVFQRHLNDAIAGAHRLAAVRDAIGLHLGPALGHAPRPRFYGDGPGQESHRLGRLESGRINDPGFLRTNHTRFRGDFALRGRLHENEFVIDEYRQRIESGRDRAGCIRCECHGLPCGFAVGHAPAQLNRAAGYVGQRCPDDGMVFTEFDHRFAGEHRRCLFAQHEGFQLAAVGRLEDHAEVAVGTASDGRKPADIAPRRFVVPCGFDGCRAVKLAANRHPVVRDGTAIFKRRHIP